MPGVPRHRAFTLIELLIVLGIVGLLTALLLPAVQRGRQTAQRMQCESNLRQIGLGVTQYYDNYGGQFFLHHPFDADVISNTHDAESFAEIYWEDKIMPWIGGSSEVNEALAQQGINVATAREIFRCPSDPSQPRPYINQQGNVDGIADRTSYLMNSLLSHKTLRYGGRWTLMRFIQEVGTSSFLCFSERNAAAFGRGTGGDPRQDDYDVWLGTTTIRPWIAYDRHIQAANYLYLDGHVVTLTWDVAVPDMYPDKVVLTQDGSYP